MVQKKINYGAAPNDGTGDLYRVAMIKIDDNFTDLYALAGGLENNKVAKSTTLALSGGATAAATALDGSAITLDITSLDMSKASGTLAVAHGGTGVTTSTGTGANVQADSPALIGKPTAPLPAADAADGQVANVKYVKDGLSFKANSADVTTALAAKANTSDVNTALAAKADKAAMDTALAAKADKAAMDTALAAKADTSAVNSALALKVDKDGSKVLSDNNFTNAERAKLAGLDNRANHTGTQPLSTISDAGTAAAHDVQVSQRDADRSHVMMPGAFGWGISPGTQDGEVGTVLDASTVDDMGQWVSGAQRYAGTGPGVYGHVLRMGGGKNGVNGGWFADLAISTGGCVSVRINTNDGVWSDWVNVMDRSAQSGVQPLSSISGLEAASSDQVLHAIAMSKTFASVPTENQGPMIVVTQPHLRFMVWDGAKYVRAPWHMPGVLFHSHAPAASVTHGIQVRADVTYNKADYPDLAEILGVAGSTFILPEGRARVLRAADNGRGIDSALVNGYLQEDAGRNLTGGYYMAGAPGGEAWGSTGAVNGAFASMSSAPGRANFQAGAGSVSPEFGLILDASRQWPTASEFRVKSLTATLYITK